MNKKSGMLLFLLSILVPLKIFSTQEQVLVNSGEHTRRVFCSIVAGSAGIGTLTIDGVNVNSLTTLANILNAGIPLVRSVVPFGSGLISLATVPVFPQIATIPLTGLVMGFGSSSLVPAAVPTSIIPTETGFSFSVPEAGTLYNLRVSVDSTFAAALATATPITFTFAVLHSPCVSGTVSAYTATTLTATALAATPAGTVFPLAALTQGATGCGSNIVNTVPVSAGDRITILVTPSIAVLPAVLDTVAFSVGFEYAPTL